MLFNIYYDRPVVLIQKKKCMNGSWKQLKKCLFYILLFVHSYAYKNCGKNVHKTKYDLKKAKKKTGEKKINIKKKEIENGCS